MVPALPARMASTSRSEPMAADPSIGENERHVGVEGLGQQAGSEVLVHDGLDALEPRHSGVLLGRSGQNQCLRPPIAYLVVPSSARITPTTTAMMPIVQRMTILETMPTMMRMTPMKTTKDS
jgi:hypothetical protein